MYGHRYRYRVQHGIRSILHELRHTFGSAVRVKMPLTLLKSMTGHSDPTNTFGVYGREMDSEMQQTTDIADDAFEKMLPREDPAGERAGG